MLQVIDASGKTSALVYCIINAVKKFVIANKDLLIRLGTEDNFDIVDFTGAMVLP